jgi:hypothetical protein
MVGFGRLIESEFPANRENDSDFQKVAGFMPTRQQEEAR